VARDVRLIRSPISVAGMVLTTISAVLFLIVFLADLFGLHTNPYIGIVFFLLLPALFLVGLTLIPVGAWLARRRRLAGREPAELRWPVVDWNNPTHRLTSVIVFALTMANVVIVSLAAYRGVEYMDSEAFCGQACHQPMEPQFVSHQNGPHARVPCVACHVGSGAASFAQSKASGVRQLVSFVQGTYSRPIPAPVRHMRSATETCETCHSAEVFHGDTTVRLIEFAEDEKNSETVTTLRIHVGGGSERLGATMGIHWHMNVGNRIDYIAADRERSVIPYIKVTDRFGKVTEYTTAAATPELLASGERRRMDCTDCHNRSGHPIAVSPERAVNELMARGDIPRTLPFIRRESVKALKQDVQSVEAGAAAIAVSLNDFYRGRGEAEYAALRADVDRAVRATQNVLRRNVFPAMRTGFGVYPTHLGHIDTPGCFRCHDDEHKSADGRTIGQDCETCHAIE
jgi:hypothetical protein